MNEYFAGIDIGSTMTKVVIMNGGIVSSVIGPTGPEQRRLANKVMEEALEAAGLPFSAITYVVATGYGRINVPFADKQVTEITCHAKGVANFFPEAKIAIDIGGQDSKAIEIKDGKPVDFVMNEKCAAGSGRFLEVIADGLGIALDDMAELSLQSDKPVKISNLCTVFAEQEVIAQLAEGAPVKDLVAGIHGALASRIANMSKRLNVRDVIVTGGGAKNKGLVKALSDTLGCAVSVPNEPLLTGAVGAALLGKDIVQKSRKDGLALERKERVLQEVEVL
jgi:predicted CoA-substrate-specific enzyme activase